MANIYTISDLGSGEIIEDVTSRDEKSALKKFAKGLISTGFYEIHYHADGDETPYWELSTSYGRYFRAYKKQ